MDHNFGQFYNYLAYLSTVKYGTERDIKLSPNQFSFLYKKAKSSQLKCVVFLPTQFLVFLPLLLGTDYGHPMKA